MTETKVWQIAAGEPARNYTQLFLEHDIMFMGPGRYGDYNERPEEYEKAKEMGEYTSMAIGFVRRFCKDVREGDFILLRFQKKVVAIGIAHPDGYRWDETFDDVYGWDLQHTRRVWWQNHLTDELNRIQDSAEGEDIFSDVPRLSTFTEVHIDRVKDRVKDLFHSIDVERDLKELPESLPAPLELDKLGELLYQKGLPNDAVDKLTKAIEEQRRLAKWYQNIGEKSDRPKEHEVVAHMVLPFFKALGWSEQLLAVEWKKVDLAVFSSTPTNEGNCVLICEAKGLHHGLQGVLEQAKKYYDKLKPKNCNKILLTNGVRYHLFEHNKNGNWNPTGYLNIEKIRTNNIAPPNTNAVDTIMELTPAGIRD
jgi:hypothetical protein